MPSGTADTQLSAQSPPIPQGSLQTTLTALQAVGLSVRVFDPARVRYFAKARGQRAKNDTIDAALREYPEFRARRGLS